MDITKLIRKPKIDYTPETVTLQDVEPLTKLVPLDKIPEEVTRVDTWQNLAKEIMQEYDLTVQMIDDLVSICPTDIVPVPENKTEFIGKVEVGLSDYLESMSSNDYEPQMVKEIFEDYHIEAGNPEMLLFRPLHSTKSRLQTAFSSLPKQIKDSVVNGSKYASEAMESALEDQGESLLYNAEGLAPEDMTAAQAYALQVDIAGSRELRESVMEVASTAGEVLNSDLWPALFQTEDVREIQEKAREFVGVLKKIRTILLFAMLSQGTNWKSVIKVLDGYLYNYIINVQLSIIKNVYMSAYNELVAPVYTFLHKVEMNTDNFKTKSFLDKYGGKEVESIAHTFNTLANQCIDIADTITQQVADVVLTKQKQTQLEIKSTAAVKEMIRHRRLLTQIDLVIDALNVATNQSSNNALRVDIPSHRLYELTKKSLPKVNIPSAIDTTQSKLERPEEPVDVEGKPSVIDDTIPAP